LNPGPATVRSRARNDGTDMTWDLRDLREVVKDSRTR
jgi:hypothetical protein